MDTKKNWFVTYSFATWFKNQYFYLSTNAIHKELMCFAFFFLKDRFFLKKICAAKAIFYCPSMNSHRPRSQNTAKEQALIPEKDSTRKRPRSHVSLEKSSKNYKPLENWAKPNLLPDVTPQPANSFGNWIWRFATWWSQNRGNFLPFSPAK